MATKKITVNCGEAMTIAHAAELHSQCQQAMEAGSHIELDAKSVDKVDTAGLQVVSALSKELAKSGGELTWKQPSQSLLQAAKTLGLNELLTLDSPQST